MPFDAVQFVDTMLAESAGASDVHVEPVDDGYEVRRRVDGLLRTDARLPVVDGRAVVARLMVLGGLLTYRQDVPQEGRLDHDGAELRVSVMPTTRGLRAVLRLPTPEAERSLDALGLPDEVLGHLRDFAAADAGLLLVVGPAGSGKTTTLYALLRHIADHQPGLSIVSLEDPVERRLPGVTQIEVTPFGELTYERALRSMLRQDPQVLMLGEIRDAATARIAVQAALSGHRLVATLHAADAHGAVGRLLDMGVEPFGITGTLFGIHSQRLLRRKSDAGYHGRVPVATFVRTTGAVLQNLAARTPVDLPTLHDAAAHLVSAGITDDTEVQRVLGTPNRVAEQRG
ncbi:MAG: ATPase, T2SS/T4P/T4SS family [Planctomycetota bacterium]